MIAPTQVANPLAFMHERFVADKLNGLFCIPGLEVVLPSVEIVGTPLDRESIMRHLELAIRTAYKSGDKIGPESHTKILKHILSLKHESTLEHFQMTFLVRTNRGVSHEAVRHRIGHSFTQESTRYVGYDKHPPQVILPWHLVERPDADKVFWSEEIPVPILRSYLSALERGWKPQDARGFLPNDLKTEFTWSMNVRSARAMLNLRTPGSAHPDMQVVARELLRLWYETVPVLFQDIWDRTEKLVGVDA